MRYALSTLAASAAITVIATGLFTQTFAIGGAPEQAGQGGKTFDPDPNQGRFVALGGEFGGQRFACVSCHQLDGTGDRSGAFPRLSGQNAWYLYSTLQDFASGKRPNDVMHAVASELSDRQMQDVAAFYATVGPAPYPPNLNDDKQIIDRGRGIAQGAVTGAAVVPCATCHGMQGEGKSPIYPALGGQYAPYLEAQLKDFKAGKRKGDPMGIMEIIAGQMSDDDIHAVSLYYASLSPEQNASPAQFASQAGREKNANNPASRSHMGAVQNPQPGKADEVVPGASTQKQKSER